MKQDFRQIVYCNNASLMNNPANLTDEDLISGAAFVDYTPLSQLGVQAPPGTKFYVNGNENPVIVGFTGLFDINLNNGGSINSLSFDRQTLTYIKSNDSAMLVIDMAFWTGDEN